MNTNQKLILVDVINCANHDVIEVIDTLYETCGYDENFPYQAEMDALTNARKLLSSAGYSLARKSSIEPSALTPRAAVRFERAWEEEADFARRFRV